MALDRQIDFSGGLNTRIPAHKLPENMVQSATNVDFSHGDIRPDTGVGGDGGGKNYFYEKGNTWVSTDGIGGQTSRPITVISPGSTTTITATTTELGNPLTIQETGVYAINSGKTVNINDTEQGLGSVTSFVEYNDDLYMGRDYFQINATTTSGSAVITVAAADIVKLIVSDSIEGPGIPEKTKIDSLNYGTNQVTLNKNATASASNVLISVNTTPIRLIDGILSNVYQLEIPSPSPIITVTQLGEVNSDRADGHSTNWYTQNFPVPFQYGIARFDDATGGESGISSLSSMGLSSANIGRDKGSVPVLPKVKINDKDTNDSFYGKFALYRVGGTSTTVKKMHDVLLTAQEDGSPVSVEVGVSTNDVTAKVHNLPTGAEWFVKYYGYGATGSRRTYTTKGLSAINVTSAGSGYTSVPTVTVAAPGGSGGKTATAEAHISSGSVAQIVITDKGSGYESTPSVTVSGNATATAVVEAADNAGESTYFSDTNTDHKLYGGNASHQIDLHFFVKFTSTAVDPNTGKPFNEDTREYMFASTNVDATTVYADNGNGHDGCGTFLDFTPPRALIEIEPINDPTEVPYNLQYLSEYNNFFVGAIDKRLHISNYAKPNNFAIDGYLDFDAQITGIATRGGEAVVFTEFGAHRVYGNAHNEMRKVKIPTVQGIPMGMHKTIGNIRDSIIYVSHAGICMFDGRNVQVLTEPLIQDFSPPSGTPAENVAGVIDDIYYLLTSGGQGWKVDMRFGTTKICKSTINASNMLYRASVNKLFTESGFIGGAALSNNYSFETRDFTGGDITSEKVYQTIYITGSDFSGNIDIKCDGNLTDTFSFPTPQAEFNRALSLASATVANRASIEFRNCTGKIQSISVKYEMLSEQSKRRFNAVNLTYTGTPSIIAKIDAVEKIALTTLTDPGTGNTGTATLYFPSMTEGHLPHLVTNETETSRISGMVFDAEAI
tara:strand:- start:15435 stop:18284 length:2850 start_codon:yes stop_codon:yes gene_type:complete